MDTSRLACSANREWIFAGSKSRTLIKPHVKTNEECVAELRDMPEKYFIDTKKIAELLLEICSGSAESRQTERLQCKFKILSIIAREGPVPDVALYRC